MASTANNNSSVPPPPAPTAAAAPQPPPEDAAGDGGETIDTFSSYLLPQQSLPKCLLKALVETTSTTSAAASDSEIKSSSSDSASNTVQSNYHHQEQEIIEIDSSNSAFEDDRKPAAAATSDDVIDLVESDVSNHAAPDNSTFMQQDDDTTKDLLLLEERALLSKMVSSHTSPACESALLASVSAPRAPEQTGETLLELAKTGALSPLQLEGATLAIARHNRLLVDSTTTSTGENTTIRAGFFLGDGAGVGKGRQIAAVIRDSLCRGRTRHLWVSVSRELCLDAKRDLHDLGCHVDVHDGSQLLNQTSGTSSKGLGAGGSLGKGVLFVTYPLLVSGKGKRMEEIISWLAGSNSNSNNTVTAKNKADQKRNGKLQAERSFSGVIVFDEAHKAKNMEAGTQTAKLVMELQARLPHARVMYCSATGVSDLKHMVYATRLGLWGAGNSLYPTFESFKKALSNRGVGSLEMLALEMKQKGTFVARTLAWEGAEFETMQVKLCDQQMEAYDAAVEWWYMAKRHIETALSHMGTTGPKTLWRAYWSAHQRFFKELCICAKLPEVVEKATKYLQDGCAIIIGLQSTGESGTQTALEELEEQIVSDAGENSSLRRSNSGRIDFEEIVLPSLVSTSQSIMGSFIRNHFPVAPPPEEPPKVPPPPPEGFKSEAERLQYLHWQAEAERIANLPPPEPIPELVQLRSIVLESSKALVLPPNPLDDLIDRLGGVDQVAEMTGRSGRIVRTGEDQFKFIKRLSMPTKQKYGLSMPTSSEDADRLNIVEKRKFMEGKKSVAIISDAASTGISLHAAENSGAAHKRRVHFTIELPWAADKAIQQLGRSHRSGQRTAPIYHMCVTELGGERRFAAAVSKRMASLGALTKGDRRAATGSDLSDFDIDSVFGRRALKRVYSSLRSVPPSAPSRNSNAILDDFIRQASGGEAAAGREQDEEVQRAHALVAASDALDRVGLTGEAEVKVFLNRISGLAVNLQNLVFSLFMSTLDDVVTDAKATGEFEGSVEDVKATSITMEEAPTQIAVDNSSGAATMLTKITLDRGISFEKVIGFILDEEKGKDVTSDEEDDYENSFVAESGFYLSKRKIAGRHLVMFARRKIALDDVGEEFASVVDPLGLMVISRPNTGKNPCEMNTRDLRFKYNKLVTCRELIRLVSGQDTKEMDESSEETSGDEAVGVVRKNHSSLARHWDDAYSESNYDEHHMGLAPRISQIGLVTGAVLHVLPALEKATLFMTQSQRSLKVMRVELTDSGQRVVGIKFPLEEEAVEKLLLILSELTATRAGGASSAVSSFRTESFAPVCGKSTAWATTERKTMRSFFGTKTAKTTSSGTKRKDPPSSTSITPTPVKKAASSSAAKKKKTSTASISSFFTKKS